jgi:hypothetical protein
MIPHVIQITLPAWVQVVIAVTAILANVGTFAFVIFVLWPSIRNQERRANRLEAWLERDEVKQAIWKLVDKVAHGDGLTGKPVNKNNWFENETKDGERSDL